MYTHSATAESTILGPTMQEAAARADGIIYADYTNMIPGQDAIPQIAQKLVNYPNVTRSRNVNIRWGGGGS